MVKILFFQNKYFAMLIIFPTKDLLFVSISSFEILSAKTAKIFIGVKPLKGRNFKGRYNANGFLFCRLIRIRNSGCIRASIPVEPRASPTLFHSTKQLRSNQVQVSIITAHSESINVNGREVSKFRNLI